MSEVKPWGFLGDMGQAVHDHAYANGYTVVREIGGHGVGLEFHEDPWVGYNTRKGTDMVMAPGMMFTIEPMVNMGKVNVVTDEKNGWEVSTADGLPSSTVGNSGSCNRGRTRSNKLVRNKISSRQSGTLSLLSPRSGTKFALHAH